MEKDLKSIAKIVEESEENVKGTALCPDHLGLIENDLCIHNYCLS